MAKIMKVFKYEFHPMDYVIIDMPLGAKPLHVDVQDGTPCLWALVDPDAPNVPRCFRIAVTGYSIENVGDFIGTFYMCENKLVFHLFEPWPQETKE